MQKNCLFFYLNKNFCVSKKSTIFLQYLWNFVKITASCVGNFAWISAKLDENCGFFIDDEVLRLCPLLSITLYMHHCLCLHRFFMTVLLTSCLCWFVTKLYSMSTCIKRTLNNPLNETWELYSKLFSVFLKT